MRKSKLFAFIIIAALSFSMVSCGDDDSGINWIPSEGGESTGVPSTNVTSRMECPQPKGDANEQIIGHWTRSGRDSILTYCLAYDLKKLHSRWVAFRFDSKTRGRSVSRQDAWADDPSLAPRYQIGTGGFGYGYARGHICGSADRLYSREANEQTFYMTNMSPMEYNFNSGYWITLEGLVRDWAKADNADTLYVVKGGTIDDKNIIRRIERGGDRITVVPRYYYMALMKIKFGTYHSIAFLMENKNYGYDYDNIAPTSEMRQHAMNVNDLEKFTGINFFWNLPDNKEESIENECNYAQWPRL